MFVPVSPAGEVRPTMPTQTPELSRPPKPGLQRSPHPPTGANYGSPAPDAGYALTIAHHEVAKLAFEHDHDRHDVELGVALVASRRASLVGRGPILGDVLIALDIFGLRDHELVDHDAVRPFAGLAHSYVAQRRFVDAVPLEQLALGAVTPSSH
jgi:hypothetical protein